MTAETLKSALVTNLDATPRGVNSRLVQDGTVRAYFATDEAAGGDAGSTYRMIRVRGRDRITRLEIATDDLGDGTLNVGLYDVGDSAVEDADFFASALDVNSAAVSRTDITYESGVIAIENAGKAIWEQLSLDDTPENRAKEFDIYCTSVTAAATGTISMWCEVVSIDGS